MQEAGSTSRDSKSCGLAPPASPQKRKGSKEQDAGRGWPGGQELQGRKQADGTASSGKLLGIKGGAYPLTITRSPFGTPSGAATGSTFSWEASEAQRTCVAAAEVWVYTISSLLSPAKWR